MHDTRKRDGKPGNAAPLIRQIPDRKVNGYRIAGSVASCVDPALGPIAENLLELFRRHQAGQLGALTEAPTPDQVGGQVAQRARPPVGLRREQALLLHDQQQDRRAEVGDLAQRWRPSIERTRQWLGVEKGGGIDGSQIQPRRLAMVDQVRPKASRSATTAACPKAGHPWPSAKSTGPK